jgi:hypothetical protein
MSIRYEEKYQVVKSNEQAAEKNCDKRRGLAADKERAMTARKRIIGFVRMYLSEVANARMIANPRSM